MKFDVAPTSNVERQTFNPPDPRLSRASASIITGLVTSFRSTLFWVLGTALFIYSILSMAGYLFLSKMETEHAQTIFRDHSGVIVSVYLRVLVGYLIAGGLAAFVLHPFVQGWKAALAAVGLMALGFIYTLTNET
ncbi:MAG: hypothetical protein ACYS0F_06795, partial [Planctomycetota bacterium]